MVYRIVGDDKVDGWVLQGDNNEQVDFWRPRDHDVAAPWSFASLIGIALEQLAQFDLAAGRVQSAREAAAE